MQRSTAPTCVLPQEIVSNIEAPTLIFTIKHYIPILSQKVIEHEKGCRECALVADYVYINYK